MKSNIPKANMKKAVVDQIMLYMVLFTAFVSSLFLVIDYSAIMRVDSSNDTLAQYGARLKGLGIDDSEIIENLNRIKNNYFAEIVDHDLDCETDDKIENYRVIFNVESTYKDSHVLTIKDITSTMSAFNEMSSSQITCTLTLEKIVKDK